MKKLIAAIVLATLGVCCAAVPPPTRSTPLTTNQSSGVPANSNVPTWDAGNNRWVFQAHPGASGGETNTASSLGNGAQLTAGKVGVDLQFNTITNGTGIAISSNANMLSISIDPGSLPPPAEVGNTLHVEEHGDDGTGTGSVDYPFRTLTGAMEVAATGDIIQLGPGTFTVSTNAVLSNFAIVGAGAELTTISFTVDTTTGHNRVLSSASGTTVTNVLFYGFTLDGNASDSVWGADGKIHWVLSGQDIVVDHVRCVDFGGHASEESFSPLFQNATNCVVRNSVFRSPGSVNVTGPSLENSSRCVIENNTIENYNIGLGLVGNSSWNVYTGNRATNVTTAGWIYDTAGSGEIWGNTISRNRFSSGGDGILIGLGAHLDLRIFGNEFFGSNRGINLTNYNASGTNYFLRPVVTENTFYISSGRNIYGTGVTNGAFFLNVGRSTSDCSVSGSANFGAFNMDRTGALYANIPNTLQGDGSAITALNDDNVNFDDADGNWTATTIGAALEELDDANGGAPNQATGKVNWEQLVNVPAGFADGTDDGGGGSGTPTFVNGTEVTQGPDFDNTSASGTVTPTTFSVSSTNVTLTIGNASATQAGAVTTGTQSFAGAKTFTGDVTVEGTLILSGSGGGGMDSLNVTNKLTNGVLTAGGVVVAGPDKALSTDTDLAFSTDTLYATKLTSTDVRAGLVVVTNTATISQGDIATANAAAANIGSGVVTNNIAAQMNTSVSNVINLDVSTSYINVGGNIAYIHATNGAASLYKTHVAVFPNWSGGNVTLTIPSGWKTNVYSAVPANLTNGTITKMYVSAHAATGDSANQTNVTVSFEYFK